jgi:hypothetical protein
MTTANPATSAPPVVLSYAPARPRRRLRRWVLAAALLLIAGVGVAWRDTISLQAQTRFREWQCRHLPLPADQVVYSSVPTDVSRLKSDPRYVLIPAASANHKTDAVLLRAQFPWLEWNRLTRNECQKRPAVCFHPMTTPGGRRVLTSIYWGPATQHSVVYERKSLLGRPESLRDTCLAAIYSVVREHSGQIRVYPPYVDKANAARLIIPVEIGGKSSEITGTLQDSGTMIVNVPKSGS